MTKIKMFIPTRQRQVMPSRYSIVHRELKLKIIDIKRVVQQL